MKTWCTLLMFFIGMALFFLMMIEGWGLTIERAWPIVVYYVWSFIATLALILMEKIK